jgi:hypothetical protein
MMSMASGAGSSSSTGGNNATFLTTQKTARLGVGAYAPFLLSRWTWNRDPNALFIAPIAKIGFDTLAAPNQQTFTVTSGAATPMAPTTVTQNFNQLFNFYNFGMRVGHYKISGDSNRAPELISYLDFMYGPFSNLPSYVCVPQLAAAQPGTPATLPLLTGSSCNTSMPALPAGMVYGDSQTRQYRLDFEGVLKVPYTPAFVGFNANIGQRTFNRHGLDRTLQPADDLRFVFGFKADIATILQKFGVNNPAP